MPGQFINNFNLGGLRLTNNSNTGNASFRKGAAITISGNWYLLAQYTDASNPGNITFPNHSNASPSLDPNAVGQVDGAVQIYINTSDSANVNHSAQLNQLAGNNGTLSLTQGSNSVIYGFTNQAFQNTSYGGVEVYADNYYEGSVFGSITIIQAASGDFNNVDPITISYSIT